MGVDFHDIVIWIELIRNKSATEGITPKEAVSLIVQDLKSYNQLNTLQKAIRRSQQNLEALNIVIEQRQRAIASLIDFQSKGISDTELNKLINSWGGWSQEQNNNGVNTVNRLARLDDKLHLPIN